MGIVTLVNTHNGQKTKVHDSAVARLIESGTWQRSDENEASIPIKSTKSERVPEPLPGDLSIPATIAWVGDGPDRASRAELALEVEVESETPRSSLITQLKALTNTAATSQENSANG